MIYLIGSGLNAVAMLLLMYATVRGYLLFKSHNEASLVMVAIFSTLIFTCFFRFQVDINEFTTGTYTKDITAYYAIIRNWAYFFLAIKLINKIKSQWNTPL
jgi:hypothetical protein